MVAVWPTLKPLELTFAYKRAETVGAFFNASFLLALALSIVLQSIERFIDLPEIEEPKLVVIVGAVGLGLNTLCILLVHGEPAPLDFAKDRTRRWTLPWTRARRRSCSCWLASWKDDG